jgi:hypothetical protein
VSHRSNASSPLAKLLNGLEKAQAEFAGRGRVNASMTGKRGTVASIDSFDDESNAFSMGVADEMGIAAGTSAGSPCTERLPPEVARKPASGSPERCSSP